MNRRISHFICAALDEARRPRHARHEDTFEHPDAWKIDRDFNWAFLAGLALVIGITIAPMIIAPKATGNNAHRGRAKTAEYCGVSAAEYDAGKGDDTNY